MVVDPMDTWLCLSRKCGKLDGNVQCFSIKDTNQTTVMVISLRKKRTYHDKHNSILTLLIRSTPWPRSFREEVCLASAQQWSFQRNGRTRLAAGISGVLCRLSSHHLHGLHASGELYVLVDDPKMTALFFR